MMRHALGFLALCLMAACSTPEQFIAAPKVEADQTIRSRFKTIEVADVSLPAYAARNEITSTEGDLLTLSGTLWADDPTRAVTLALTRHLAEITKSRVASEPWPFDDFASARVEVRVEDLLVNGTDLQMSGQYFVVDLDGDKRDHAHLFALSTPLDDTDPASIAQGRTQLVLDLALAIAEDAL